MVVEYAKDNEDAGSTSQEVEVTLSYEGVSLTFPINPENLKQVVDSNSTTEDIESIGQISIPQRPSLSTLTFSSFFWADRDDISPKKRVEWVKNWQKSRKPARLSVTSIDWDMDVTCESFSYWVNAGEEKDVYFTISLMEYRAYGAKQVRLVGNQYILDENGVKTVVGTTLGVSKPSLPYGTYAKSRSNVHKKNAPISIMVGDDESIVSIESRYAPERHLSNPLLRWKDVYIENREEIVEKSIGDILLDAPVDIKNTLGLQDDVQSNYKSVMTNLKNALDKYVFIYGPPVNI